MSEPLYSTGDIAEKLGLSLNVVCYRVRELVRRKKLDPVLKTSSANYYGKEALKAVKDFGSKVKKWSLKE